MLKVGLSFKASIRPIKLTFRNSFCLNAPSWVIAMEVILNMPWMWWKMFPWKRFIHMIHTQATRSIAKCRESERGTTPIIFTNKLMSNWSICFKLVLSLLQFLLMDGKNMVPVFLNVHNFLLWTMQFCWLAILPIIGLLRINGELLGEKMDLSELPEIVTQIARLAQLPTICSAFSQLNLSEYWSHSLLFSCYDAC